MVDLIDDEEAVLRWSTDLLAAFEQGLVSSRAAVVELVQRYLVLVQEYKKCRTQRNITFYSQSNSIAL